jgi:RNA polymerase-binding protein DksA
VAVNKTVKTLGKPGGAAPAVKPGNKTTPTAADNGSMKTEKPTGGSPRTASQALVTKGSGARPVTPVRPIAALPKPRPSPTVKEPPPQEPPTEEQLRKVKTGLTKKDIDHFRQLLLQKRAEIVGDVTSMEVDARKQHSGGNLSNMPVHMADVGSDNYEQEFTLGLVESERKLIREIDAALLRIQNGTYGVCLERGVPIGKARLEAKPWAKYCIEVARERERRGEFSS